MDLFGKKANKELSHEILELSHEILELKKLAANARGFESINLQNIAANLNRNIAIYPTSNIKSYYERYVTTDDIYSIVKSISEMEARVPIYPYLVVDEPAAKKLSKIKQPAKKLFERKLLQVKSLEDLPENDRVEMLLENPSQSLSKFEFYVAIYTFLNLFGEAFILKERPSDGTNAGLTVSMHVLYPQNIVLLRTDTPPYQVTGYRYTVNGQVIYDNLPIEDVMHIKYFNPEMDGNGSELRGLSPIKVLCRRLTQNDGITDVTTSQMQNSGVETIVYDKSVMDDANVDVIGKRKDNFYKFLKNPGNAGAPYFASGEMGSIQLGSTMKDLKALEALNVTFKKFCNAYGVSDILFNSDAASTESNVKEMEQRAYTNTILPNVHRVRDIFKMQLLSEFQDGRVFQQVNEQGDLEVVRIKGDGIKRDLLEDISEIPSLQEDMLAMSQWMNISPEITYNERRLMKKFDKLDNPLFDEPFLPIGLQTVEDLVAPPIIDNSITPGNAGNGL